MVLPLPVSHSSPSPPSAPPLPTPTSPRHPTSSPVAPPTTSSTLGNQPPSPPAKTPHRPTTRSQHGIFRPKRLFLSQVSHPLEPTTVKQALQDPRWTAAMWAEFRALLSNHTWTLVPCSLSHNIVDCRWIFRIKWKPDGTIDCFKARLVAKGYTQRLGIDFHDTYNQVLKPVTIRTVFTIAQSHQWPILQFDVNNAFLQGSLDETIYMTQPLGFRDSHHPDYVCCLSLAIYGLHQVPRSWYLSLSGFLEHEGFVKSKSDASLFVYHKADVTMYFLVYVDDLLLTSNHGPSLARFQERLADRFSLKSLGQVNYFLGIEVLPHSHGYLLSQHKYVMDILHRFNMADSHPAPTPLSSSAKLTLVDGSPPTDVTLYK
ncbi:unnamed protein product [Linum trigynum]|uniref:Reverse transcriptase Ty1/copia-type domain-containing protein n=1 Tax=Linum trigynum TaxID=586398 RepID=A0AAV2FQY1_9ROSI